MIEVNAEEELPFTKQMTNPLQQQSMMESAQATILSCQKCPVLSSPSATMIRTAFKSEQSRKRAFVSIDGLTAISDDEGDSLMTHYNHSVIREGTTVFQVRARTYKLSIAPVPIGRPLAASPSFPRCAPGQVASDETAIGWCNT